MKDNKKHIFEIRMVHVSAVVKSFHYPAVTCEKK